MWKFKKEDLENIINSVNDLILEIDKKNLDNDQRDIIFSKLVQDILKKVIHANEEIFTSDESKEDFENSLINFVDDYVSGKNLKKYIEE